MRLLSEINDHDDLLRLTEPEMTELCAEIREFLISSVSRTGGHLAGNLGAVELSVALETVYDTRTDRLVFDVGHQSYTHKLLTGRREAFDTLRQYNGLSGFPKPSESGTDAFVAGHASSSVSIALGMARARTLTGQSYQVAAVIGDGAASGGMAYEGMNDAADSGEPLVIILNDNEMSIGKNVGGVSRHLARLRTKPSYQGTKRWYRRTLKHIPGGQSIYRISSRLKNRIKRLLVPTTIFENMGLEYLGPVDGHDLPRLISVLRVAREMQCPVLVHVVTRKGAGYAPAEADPETFHGIGAFDPVSGKKLGSSSRTFSSAFGEKLTQLAEQDKRVCAVTAAMPAGTGLVPFAERFPARFFDVGIAEEHAVSMAGGMAKQGLVPVAAIYSTFLQRAFDQILQDISMLRLHAVLAIDRAGLVGDDGPTHHGVFDVGFLTSVPGLRVLAPASLREMEDMLTWAVIHQDGPAAIRYPRGSEGEWKDSAWDASAGGAPVFSHRSGEDITLISYGVYINEVLTAAAQLEEQGIHAAVLRLTELQDIDAEKIRKYITGRKRIFIPEVTAAGCGIRERLAWALRQADPEMRVFGKDAGRDFVPHGDLPALYRLLGLDAASLVNSVKEVLDREE